jgi:hypothetical protein
LDPPDGGVGLAPPAVELAEAFRGGSLGRGRGDAASSAIERLFAFTNGPAGADNPQRQGLTSAIRGEGDPLNTFGGIPTLALDYSPPGTCSSVNGPRRPSTTVT